MASVVTGVFLVKYVKIFRAKIVTSTQTTPLPLLTVRSRDQASIGTVNRPARRAVRALASGWLGTVVNYRLTYTNS